jgi:UDPglucose 6-dehydrogenase/GDP-mannose 6-dehydrogenase
MDTLVPDRIVIGQYDKKSGHKYALVFKDSNAPILFTNLATAEMIKYTANSLLATLISFSNEIARIAEDIPGIDVLDIWKGVHLDARLTPEINKKRIIPGIVSYILSGPGFGGSCFPKDTKAFAHFASTLSVKTPILNGVITINDTQPERMFEFLKSHIGSPNGKRIAILGLSFKPNTDDLREPPALCLIKLLKKSGAKIIGHDPLAYKARIPVELKQLELDLAATIEQALKDADVCMVVTAWDEYKKLTPDIFKKAMKTPIVIDGRRIYDKEIFTKAGIAYEGIGLG